MKKRKFRGLALISAGMLSVCCLASGCQATPEREAVVNQAQTNSSWVSAAPDAGEAAASDAASSTDAIEWTASERWTESVTPEERLTITADTDVLTPSVSAFPVTRITRTELPQETVDTLAARFVPDGTVVYKLPLKVTKAQYEQELLDMKQTMSEMQADGAGPEDLQDIQAAIEEVEQQYAEAPDTNEMTEGDFTYAYDRDYQTGQDDTSLGQDYINVAGATSDGENFEVRACRVRDSVGRDAFFEYTQAGYTTEKDDRERLEDAQEAAESGNEKAAAGASDEYIQELNDRLAQHEQNPIDLEAATAQALELAQSLGIEGLTVADAQHALYSVDTSPLENGVAFLNDAGDGYSGNAALVELARANGGVPCVTLRGGDYSEESLESAYSAPFAPETLSVLIAEDGSVKNFLWYAPSQVVETVSQDSELIPFEEAKDRIVEQFKYLYLPWLDTNDSAYEVNLDDVRLVMTYVNAENDPESVLAVPAWYASGSLTEKTNGFGDFITPAEIMISAANGAPVLAPGTIQTVSAERG